MQGLYVNLVWEFLENLGLWACGAVFGGVAVTVVIFWKEKPEEVEE